MSTRAREPALAQFAREYRAIRRAEGWGSRDGDYYRALPYRDLTGRFSSIWRIRARSYETFIQRIVEPLEHHRRLYPNPNPNPNPDPNQPLTILDLGAGNGWLAYRLAIRGHRAVAIDLSEDPLDGLGAMRHYDVSLCRLVAEFDRLPIDSGIADVVVFNASFHYSTDYLITLRESKRVLREQGTLVILDSPMYRDPSSGARMVQERRSRFLATYGFASDALPSEHFLTRTRLDALSAELGIAWKVYRPPVDWRSSLERAIGGVRARREPAHFPVIVGTQR